MPIHQARPVRPRRAFPVVNVQIHSATAAMAYALRWGCLPASLLTPALLADLIERGWAQPGTTARGPVLTLTKKGHVEGVCLLS